MKLGGLVMKNQNLEMLTISDSEFEELMKESEFLMDFNETDLVFQNEEKVDCEEGQGEKSFELQEIQETNLVVDSEDDDFETFEICEEDIQEIQGECSLDKEDLELDELSLNEFIPAVSKPITKTTVSKGLVSIIYAKTGKRIVFDQTFVEDLGVDKTLQIGYNDCHLLLGSNLSPSYKDRTLRKQGSKYVLYDSALIQELISNFNLDYTGVTSKTFNQVTYKQCQGNKVALITIKK